MNSPNINTVCANPWALCLETAEKWRREKSQHILQYSFDAIKQFTHTRLRCYKPSALQDLLSNHQRFNGEHAHGLMEWNRICYLDQRPSTGTSKVIQHGQKKERKRNKNRTRRKHPTKFVEAATCCLLSPLTTTTGWILRGSWTYG